jgi:hypothetical protein
MGYVTNPGVTGRDLQAFAGYGGGYVDPDQSLEGIFGKIWGGIKKVGGAAGKVGKFTARRIAPLAIGAIPIVGGAAASAYSGLVSPTTGRTTAGEFGTTAYRTPVGIAPQTQTASVSFLDRLRAAADAARTRALEDARVQEFIVSQAAQRIPPQLTTAVAVRQAQAAPDWMKGGVILPALAIGAVILLTARR